MYLLYIWYKLQLRVKTDKEIYISADRRALLYSTLLFGLVVDFNRVDVIVESGPLHWNDL